MLSPEDLDAATLLSLLGGAVDRDVLTALTGTGMRRGHRYVVQRLLEGPATATELATVLGVSQQAVSKSVQELLALGHVERAGGDGRSKPVRLSRSGLDAVARARTARAKVTEQLREHLGAEQLERLRADLLVALDATGIAEEVRGRRVVPSADQLG